MQYSLTGEHLTEQFESCQLTAYQDVNGVWTIGWGHTGPEVVEGLTWTQEEADAALMFDVQMAADCVNQAVINIQLTQDEFDALVDFVFNLGCEAFENSTMLKDLNQGNFAAAAEQFDLWDHAGGKVVAGLLRRRQAEAQLFDEGEGEPASAG
jgi:lysozyme